MACHDGRQKAAILPDQTSGMAAVEAERRPQETRGDLRTLGRILVISYAFPPTGGAGVQRPAKFVKYMRNYGYDPTVLTVENPSVPLRDESMSSDVGQHTVVLKARTLEPSYQVKKNAIAKSGRRLSLATIARSLLIPDPQVLWIPGLVRKVLSLRSDPPDAIFVTAPPFSTLVAGVFAKSILRRPLILDFRDEWVGWLDGSSWTNLGTRGKMKGKVERRLERFVVDHADAVVAASQGYVDAFARKYPRAPRGKFNVITNGYDPEDLKCMSRKEDFAGTLSEHRFNVLYMGTVFPLTSLRYFLDGVASARAKKDLNIVIAGRITPEEEKVLNSHGDLMIKRLGYMPHAQAIQLAYHADALLLTLSPLEGAERVIPAKMFEYMALGRNVIAILPEGTAAAILKGLSGCVILDPSDKMSIGQAYQSLFDKWRGHTLVPAVNDVSAHSREKKTEALCALFDKVLCKEGHGL